MTHDFDRPDVTELPANAPVLVGVGLISQREEDPRHAKEPLALMLEAARAAGIDSGTPANLAKVEKISIPRGRWYYGDPARLIAREIGAPEARTQMGKVGVLQQTLIGLACQSIVCGEHRAVLVVGGDAGHRILRAKKTGTELAETVDDRIPDEVLAPQAALRSPAELAAGLSMPVGLYALIDSALRTARGETLDEQRARIGRMYEGFSRVAAVNSHAWRRDILTAAETNQPGPGNPMQATPYTKLHCSNWSVDQASALLLMSAGCARDLGIPQEKWVYALASSESNYMETLSSRREMHRSPGARVAGAAALTGAQLEIADVDLLDLYTCFPIAPELIADELRIPRDRSLTITGGMSFAGGPYNNSVLHATAQMAEKLRAGEGRTGLVGAISGILTKQGFGLWSMDPPKAAFGFFDVTEQVAQAAKPMEVVEGYEGRATIAAWTVLHSPDAPPRIIVVADTDDGRRCVAASSDAALVSHVTDNDIADTPIIVSRTAFKGG